MKKTSVGKQKLQKFLNSKGFYIVLAFCLVGAGVASAMGIRQVSKSIEKNNTSIVEEQKKNNSQNTEELIQKTEQEISDVKKPNQSSQSPNLSQNSPSSQQSQQNQSDIGEKPEASQKSQDQLYILPVAGEVSTSFSGDKLIKNETLNIWRTHNGIDVKAKKGTPVKAVNGGEIIKVFEDAIWGVAIEIKHQDGIVSSYFGLEKSVKVKEKDVVKLGDIIGVIGAIPAEKTHEHIHFEMKKEGKFIDPMSLIKKSN